MPRLYHDPARPDSSIPVYWGRLAFLECVAEEVSDVLEKLRDNVLPVFHTTWQDTDRGYLRQWSTLRTIAAYLREMPDDCRLDALARLGVTHSPVPLVDKMTAWLADSNLPNDWCADHALLTLRWWAKVTQAFAAQSRLSWHDGGMVTRVHPLNIPPLEPWQGPTIEPLDAFEQRVHEWKQWNREAGERAATEAGYVMSSEKHARVHYTWLALYQCGGLSHAAIAKRYARGMRHVKGVDRPGRKTVSDGIATTAQQIGLTLSKRTTRPGG